MEVGIIVKLCQRILSRVAVKNVILLIAGFLIGRVRMFNGMTPFCIPFFVSGLVQKQKLPIIGLAIIIGIISAGDMANALKTLALLCFLYLLIYRSSAGASMLKAIILSFATVLGLGMLQVFFEGFLFYDMLIVIFEAFIISAGVWTFRNVATVLEQYSDVKTLFNEDFVCIIVVLTVISCGLANIRMFDMYPTNIIGILLILIFAHEYGVGMGTICGALVGSFYSAVLPVTPLIIGSYSVCGMLAGLLGVYGRIGTSLGVVLGNSLLTIYLNGSVESLIILKEIVVSILIFMLVSDKVSQLGILAIGKEPIVLANRKTYGERVKEIFNCRLQKISAAFSILSKNVAEVCSARDITNINDITSVFDRVVDRICRDCSLCLTCWEKSFYSTQQIMVKAVSTLENTGHLGIDDLPDYFAERCVRLDALINALNNSYDIYRTELLWQGKLDEGKQIMSKQFSNTAQIISNVLHESDYSISFMNGVEKIIINKLRRKGISVKDVVAYRDVDNRFNVTIYYQGRVQNVSTIMKNVIYETTGKKMLEDIYIPDCRFKSTLDISRFIEQENFGVIIGTANVVKKGSTVSGDSFVFRNLQNGKFLIALSDGTGSGVWASKQSERIVTLFEQLVASGFTGDTAINILDSIFMIDITGDMSATIDCVIVDLYNGYVDFIKRGAVPSVVIDGSSINVIEKASLPIGIPDMKVQVEKRNMSEGGLIVLMTDGVYDAGSTEYGKVTPFLEFLHSRGQFNPQKVADDIMQKVLQICDHTPEDDMLVVVIKIWKRV